MKLDNPERKTGSPEEWSMNEAAKKLPANDFGVSMREEVLKHKQNDGYKSRGAYCYWDFGRTVPTDIGEGSKLWVASKGRWRGYFIIHVEPIETEVHFWSESWTEEDGGPRKPFQGFTRKVPSALMAIQ